MTLGDGIRRAVNASGLSRYRICIITGIDKGAMSRFMASKAGLSVEVLETLARAIGYDVTLQPHKKRKVIRGEPHL